MGYLCHHATFFPSSAPLIRHETPLHRLCLNQKRGSLIQGLCIFFRWPLPCQTVLTSCGRKNFRVFAVACQPLQSSGRVVAAVYLSHLTIVALTLNASSVAKSSASFALQMSPKQQVKGRTSQMLCSWLRIRRRRIHRIRHSEWQWKDIILAWQATLPRNHHEGDL